jgi:hypothetical protein
VIEMTRRQARQLRAVLRKAVPLGIGRVPRPPLVLQANSDGLRIRAHQLDVTVEYLQPGSRPLDTLALPGEFLDDIEGARDSVVTLEKIADDTVQAKWDDGGLPQVRDYRALDLANLPPFPQPLKKWLAMEPSFLAALHEASRTAATDGVRFAVQKLQLRGSKGEVIATDGRQLLIQGGFALPWKDALLVPATTVFGCSEFPRDTSVLLGATDSHVVVRVGPWTVYLTIDKESRFPQVDRVIPPLTGAATTCRLSPEDAAFLAKALPRLPGHADDHEPVTVDLNGQVLVRARDEEQQRITELVLNRSEVTGPPVQFVSNRCYLTRAVQLGLTTLQIVQPTVPIVCRDEARTYLWVPLDPTTAVAPAENSLRIFSDGKEAVVPLLPPDRRNSPVTRPPTNGHGNGSSSEPTASRTNEPARQETAANGIGIAALIAEAQALKDIMRDGYERANRLLVALKRHGKQSELLRSTLASLKQLQGLSG